MPTKKQTPKRKATTARKTQTPRKKSQPKRITAREQRESDSTYFLKLVLVAILGTVWLKFGTPVQLGAIPLYALPLGLLIGVILVKYFEVHEDDRKIWYAVLLVVGIMSYFVPAGIVI